jgi:spermidine synthase
VVIEPLTNLTFQSDAWMMGFSIYVLFCFILSYFLYGHVTTESIGSDSSTKNRDRASWFVLSMAGVLVLLSSTNELTREVAPVPLLWTLPLAVYLLTFIICFDRPNWYRPIFFYPLFGFSLASILYLYTTEDYQHLGLNITVYSFFIFSACMICHGELERRKPHFDDLTEYYLVIALGGVVGGLLINLLAPPIFNDYIEFESIVLLTTLVSGFFLTVTPVKRILVRITSLATISLCGYIFYDYRDHTVTLYESRNFYGALRVIDLQPDTPGHHRKLLNDDINHGSQFQSDEFQQRPTTYFSYKSGVGIVLLTHRPPDRSVGIIGLGPGTLAAYGRTGDRFRFYELNPEVLEIAQTYFSYLSRSPAQIEVVIGDARVALQKDLEGNVKFDILVIDAFSGDSIPTHLLTEEAWQLYWKILAPGGVLAVHLSNKYLDLIPVVQHHNMNMPGYVLRKVDSKEDESWDIHIASWLIQTANNDFLDAVETHTQSPDSPKTPIRWRDDRSSVINLFN